MSTNPNPIDQLEIRALKQRIDIHETIDDLKDKVKATRAKLDLPTNVRAHFLGASLAVSSLGVLVGYRAAGLFTRR
jgi:hypothetical protein